MSSSWARIGAAALGLIGLAGCAEVETVKAPIDIPSRIYTANESSNDVSVIDATSFAPVGNIDSKTNPRMTSPSHATAGASTPQTSPAAGSQ